MKPEKHKHTMAVRYKVDQPDDNRPGWAESYKGEKRWLIIDYCTGCNYERARNVTYDKPKVEVELSDE